MYKATELVMTFKKSPLLATTFEVGKSRLEERDELVICVMPCFCGHFADYELHQIHVRVVPQVPFRGHGHHAKQFFPPNVASNRRWKADLLVCVDVREEPCPSQVHDGDPVAVHANPESVVHERQDGSARRMVEGHSVVDGVVRTTVIIVPTGRIRHQQAGSIPMVQTHRVGDMAVQPLGSCGQPDGAGNVQTPSDEGEDVGGELSPVVRQVVARCRHRVNYVIGVLEERASGRQGKCCGRTDKLYKWEI